MPDGAAAEDEVYSHLANFFRRYYKEGDFISQRRYKEGVYAIPYEGEEVKLHWANADQYYIKTSEQFRDYTFQLTATGGGSTSSCRGRHRAGNNKPQAGQERRFILLPRRPRFRSRWRAGHPRRVPTGRDREEAEGLQRGDGLKRRDGAVAPGLGQRFATGTEPGAPLLTPARPRRRRPHPAGEAPERLHGQGTPSTTSSTRTWAASCGGSWTSTSRTRSCTWTTSTTRRRPAKVEQYLEDQGHPQGCPQDHRLSGAARGLPEEALAQEEVRGRDELVHHAGPRRPGTLLPGDMLPTTRSARSGYGCSPSTS